MKENKDKDAGKVVLSDKEYKELLDSSFFLLCLQNAGVDNWSGYSIAMKEYIESEEDYLS